MYEEFLFLTVFNVSFRQKEIATQSGVYTDLTRADMYIHM